MVVVVIVKVVAGGRAGPGGVGDSGSEDVRGGRGRLWEAVVKSEVVLELKVIVVVFDA